jgi:hypothetical protein
MIHRPHRTAVTILSLGIAGLSASAASAASSQIPFRASFAGSGEQTSQTTTAFQGSGTATHLGRIATDGHVLITGFDDSSCPGGVPNINVETLTAANGDTLTITSQDVACPTAPGVYHGTGQWTVTAGTGRFSDAAGHGSYDGSADFNAGTFYIDLTGTLRLNVRP